MFKNIGKKIKILAAVISLIGIIGSVVGFFILLVKGIDEDDMFIGISFVVLIGGVFVSWIGSFFAYGFGELIDRTQNIDEKLNVDADKPKSIRIK